ncbi:MAG: GINS complex subunit Sld5 [Pyrobaculum sp.]
MCRCVAFNSVANYYPVRVTFRRDVSLPLLGVSYQANTVAEVPLYLALKLDEMGAVEIDEAYALPPRDVASLKYVEQRETYPAKLPEGFYPRLRLTIYLLSKRGDAKTVKTILQDVRELLIERVKKMALLVATRHDVINDQSFMERLTPEEKALLMSMYNAITQFMLSVL